MIPAEVIRWLRAGLVARWVLRSEYLELCTFVFLCLCEARVGGGGAAFSFLTFLFWVEKVNNAALSV